MRKTSGVALTDLNRLIAGILVMLFVVTTLAALVLSNMDRLAFDPGTYKQALVNRKFYGQFPYLLSDLLVRNIDGNAPAFLSHLSTDQWTDLIKELLPEQQLQSMTEDTLDQFFAFLNGETDTPRISLIPLKTELVGPAGFNAALTIIHAQPDCTVLEILKVVGSFGQELCNPPQSILELLHPVIQGQLQMAAAVIPDEIPFLPASTNPAVESEIKTLGVLRLLMRLSPVIPIFILFILTLVTVRTFKGWLVWWGWPFFLTGLFGIPLAFTAAPILRWVAERWISTWLPFTFPLAIVVSLRAVVDAAFSEILKPAVWESLAFFITGLVMILISAYLSIREKRKFQPGKLIKIF